MRTGYEDHLAAGSPSDVADDADSEGKPWGTLMPLLHSTVAGAGSNQTPRVSRRGARVSAATAPSSTA